MTPAEVAQRQFEALNTRDRAGWCATGASDVSIDQGTETGLDMYGVVYDVLVEAFPDVRMEMVSAVEQGDRVACEVMLTGTQTGTLRWPAGHDESGDRLTEVPPTGKRIAVKFANFMTVRDDKIVVDDPYGMSAPIANQLGLKFSPLTPA